MASRSLTLLAVIFVPLSTWLLVFYGREQWGAFQKMVGAHESSLATKEDISVSESVQKEDKPLFILHVGPEKTGTSTAQLAAYVNRKILLSDGITFIGHANRPEVYWHDLCWSCSRGLKRVCEDRWAELEETVNAEFEKNHTTFFSEELLSRDIEKMFVRMNVDKYLVPMLSKWHVRTVMTYRRFYEWGPSDYAQRFSPKGKDRWDRWPDSGGIVIPSFPDYFDNDMEKHFKRLVTMQKRWKARFPDLRIFNMHEQSQYPANFFCTMLPEAPSMCKELKLQHEDFTKNQGSTHVVHHDMIAVEAHKQQRLRYNISRTEARDAIEKHAKELGLTNVVDFPRKCLSKSQTEKLLKWSVRLESQMAPEFFASPSGEAELKAGFVKAVDAGKFCAVDVAAILNEKKWLDFFEQLGRKSKSKGKRKGTQNR